MPSKPSYLLDTTLRLAAGIGRLPPDLHDRHLQFLKIAQQDDGGFGGRIGFSDPYYTSFALRSLAILGALYGEVAESAAAFLRSQSNHLNSPVDLASSVLATALLESAAGVSVFGSGTEAWHQKVAGRLDDLRRSDGGYGKSPRGAKGSTYHTFLALICFQLMNYPIPHPEAVIQFVLSQRAQNGGFREIHINKRAGTNPTAAAIGALRILHAIDDNILKDTVSFLSGMQTIEGGLAANSAIPFADTLSTFTGLMTLTDLEAQNAIDHATVSRFVQSMEDRSGGFRAAAWDNECDVEYTFYGLGCLALLS